MINSQESQLTVTKALAKPNDYYTLTENNFGSLHHVTFSDVLLGQLLPKLHQKQDNTPSSTILKIEITDGEIWQNNPYPGFVKIWQAEDDKRRSISLTTAQINELLIHFGYTPI